MCNNSSKIKILAVHAVQSEQTRRLCSMYPLRIREAKEKQKPAEKTRSCPLTAGSFPAPAQRCCCIGSHSTTQHARPPQALEIYSPSKSTDFGSQNHPSWHRRRCVVDSVHTSARNDLLVRLLSFSQRHNSPDMMHPSSRFPSTTTAVARRCGCPTPCSRRYVARRHAGSACLPEG